MKKIIDHPAVKEELRILHENIRRLQEAVALAVKELAIDAVVGARTIPPTVEGVAAYCRERGNSVDPEAFVAYYEARGWMLGKVRMKNWQAAVRTWEKNNFPRNGQPELFSGIRKFVNGRDPDEKHPGDQS